MLARLPSALLAAAPLGLLACQEPFAQDRHDLVDFRIAAMALAEGEPRALVWSGEGAFHATAPTLEWAQDGATWTLRAEDADGDVETGALTVEEGAETPVPAGFTRTVDGDVATLAFDLGDAWRTHWMSPVGTFEESGPHATAWTADADGIWPVVALHFDGHGGNAWTVLDVPVGVEPPWLEVGGRIFPLAASLAGEGGWEATVEADDDALAGIRLRDVAAAEAPADGEAFDFDALVEGRIGRDAVVGTRVRFVGRAVP